MQESDGGRYGGSTSNAYSPNLVRPGGRSPGSGRTALKVFLCVFLPPVGLVYIWRTRSFRLRGRVLTSIVSFVMLLIMCLPLFRQAQITPVPPQASAPVAATRAPEEDTVTALSNIEELLIAQEAAEAAELGEGETAPAPEPTDEPVDESVYDTIVYVANGNARFYHSSSVCGTQRNPNQYTLRQALLMGLGAHQDCNAPVP